MRQQIENMNPMSSDAFSDLKGNKGRYKIANSMSTAGLGSLRCLEVQGTMISAESLFSERFPFEGTVVLNDRILVMEGHIKCYGGSELIGVGSDCTKMYSAFSVGAGLRFKPEKELFRELISKKDHASYHLVLNSTNLWLSENAVGHAICKVKENSGNFSSQVRNKYFGI
jgi:hypothetical protein